MYTSAEHEAATHSLIMSEIRELMNDVTTSQRWSRGHKARGQGQGHKKNPRPRPRTRTAFPRTDTLEAKDRNARGQGQGPRTQSASALQKKKVFTKIFQAISKKKKKKKKKKKVFTKIFQAISTKKRFPNNFSGQFCQFSRTNFQANFRGLEASRPRPRTSKSVLEDSTSATSDTSKQTMEIVWFLHSYMVCAATC